MVMLVKLLGVGISVMGIIFFIKPVIFKNYIEFWRKKNRILAGGVISIIVGIVFLVAALECRLAWVIITFGVWAIIKGIIIFKFGEKLNAYLDWWLKKPLPIVRLLGIVSFVLGMIILYSA